MAVSVTKAPHNLFTSQASLVVATPAVVQFSLSQAIFGVAKYGFEGEARYRLEPLGVLNDPVTDRCR